MDDGLDLDKMADDLFNDLMGKSSKGKKSNSGKDASENEERRFSDNVYDLVDHLRMDGYDVPDSWEEMVGQMEDEFDSLFADEFLDEHDPEERDFADDLHPDLYEFEFKYMPAWAETDWVDASSRDFCLGDADTVLANARERGIEISSKDFNITRQRRDGLEIYVYDFPVPPRSPFALYGAIVYGRRGGRYFTLEVSEGGYMFCSQTSRCHSNFGELPECSKEHFIKTAIAMYKANVVH